jgi:processive 1,2-diacylglycerol beta-glucosyltransferase
MTDILIIHASCGGGHKAAARALENALREAAPRALVRVVDALAGVRSTFRRVYCGSFETAVSRAPRVYAAMFRATRNLDRSPVFRAARGLSCRLNAEPLVALLRETRPRAVVCTHFLPLDVALRERRAGRLDASVHAVVTDYTAHGFWRQPDADATFCPPGRSRGDLLAGGVPMNRIQCTGIPIDPAFARPYDPFTAKVLTGLSATRPTVLLLAGGTGMGPLVQVLEETARACGPEADLVVVCGKNEALVAAARAAAERLHALGGCSRFRIHGYVERILPLMQGADVVVTKPGGLTTSECLALGKPIVFYVAAPGQETANEAFVVERGAGIAGGAPAGAARAAAALLRDPATRARLARGAARIARPFAASEIAAAVLARLGPREAPQLLAAV